MIFGKKNRNFTLYSSINYRFLANLEKHVEEVLKTKDRVLISVVGRGGTGKSYFGQYIRNNGLGKFSKRVIAVIDDSVIWLEFLCIFRRAVKIPYNGVDKLQPFLKKLPERKKIIFYINATPWNRITEANILLKLSTDENTRGKRLQQRYADNPKMFKTALNSNDDNKNYGIKYTFLIEASV